MADVLVFDLDWRPADLEGLSIAEIFYWFGRAVKRAKERRSRK